MKLGASYNVFDGIELLEPSIKQIRPYVDYISIVYQEKSYFGHENPTNGLRALYELKTKGLVDHIILYAVSRFANSPFEAKVMEKEKRTLGLESCKTEGCDYFLGMDCDEFYIPEQFKMAKETIEENNYNHTACKIKNYYKSPVFQNVGYDLINVPFICKIQTGSTIGFNGFFCNVDVTRTVSTGEDNNYLFPETELIMHHMTGVRKNLKLKWQATSRANLQRDRIKELNEKIDKIDPDNLKLNVDGIMGIENEDFVVVDNIFNLNLE